MSLWRFRDEWLKLRANGVTMRKIATCYRVSPQRVHQITGNMGPVRKVVSEPGKRPPWTFPGPELIRLAHEARDEIRANWR